MYGGCVQHSPDHRDDVVLVTVLNSRKRRWTSEHSHHATEDARRNRVWDVRCSREETGSDLIHDGRPVRMLAMPLVGKVWRVQERVSGDRCIRRLTSEDVLERLSDLFIHRGSLEYIRSDHGLELTAHRVRDWLENVRARTLFIEPGNPLENGFIKSSNGKLRDELLNVKLFDTLLEQEY